MATPRDPSTTSATAISEPAFDYASSPNAAILVESLRRLNYSDTAACLDLADNSLDAGARHVRFLIRGEKRDRHNYVVRICLVDDGRGMSLSGLGEALRLGSNSPHDITSDLGKFGMGLCTASWSLCRKTTVLTKMSDGDWLKGVNDIDEIKRVNEFRSARGKAPAADRDWADQQLKELARLAEESREDKGPYQPVAQGTIVILEKIDNLSVRTVEAFSQHLIKDVGRVYRHFIAAGKQFWVNDVLVKAVDPLEWDNPKTVQLLDESIQVSYLDENNREREETIHVRLAALSKNPESGERAVEAKEANQGFYIVRNHREIARDSSWLGLTARHNSLNYARAEIQISGLMDVPFKVGVQKNGINLPQSISDKLHAKIVPQLASIRKRVDSETRANVPEELQAIHEAAAREIQKKAKLLTLPPAVVEKRNGTGKGGKVRPSSGGEKTRTPGESRQPGLADRAKFVTRRMGEAGVVFEAYQDGPTVLIELNSDHPFYKRFILDNADDNQALIGAVDYLLYSWALAELNSCTSTELKDLLDNIKGDVSKNLRVLLR